MTDVVFVGVWMLSEMVPTFWVDVLGAWSHSSENAMHHLV